jgi:hypothetical protein
LIAVVTLNLSSLGSPPPPVAAATAATGSAADTVVAATTAGSFAGVSSTRMDAIAFVVVSTLAVGVVVTEEAS